MGRRTLMVLAACILVGLADTAGRAAVGVAAARRASYYVAPPPKGLSDGTGSRERPWDLATALAGADGRVQAGDTVWLLGGTYRGLFRTELSGRPDEPIVFRQGPGERATIDGQLSAKGSYLVFWGFEILQSDPLAVNTRVLEAWTNGGRFVNLVLHDAGISGVSVKAKTLNVELYGNVIYNNGTHENHDHGVYAHNESGTRDLIADNVFFNNYARGIQIYDGKGPVLQNFDVVGNISFNNGTISGASTRVNLLVNAKARTEGMVVRDNLLYFSPGVGGINVRVGNVGAEYNKDIVVQNNYAGGGEIGLEMTYPWDRAIVEGNTFIGGARMAEVGGDDVAARYRWGGNTYYGDRGAKAWRYAKKEYDLAGWQRASGLGATDRAVAEMPTGPQVFVRPNKYEPGRAHIVIYNWGRQGVVSVDVSRVVGVGSRFEVRNVQDLFGAPVLSGTYQGGEITIPMNGVTPPAPIGRAAPIPAPRTGPDFDVFVLTSAPS